MKKLLTILFVLGCLSGYSQTGIQFLGAPQNRIEIRGQSLTDSIFWPTIRDTTFIPNFEGAITYRLADHTFYGYRNAAWQSLGNSVWGGIGGTFNNQTDVRDSVRARQYTLSNAYGITIVGHNALFDSANVRKVDSIWRVPGQALIYYSINGVTRSILDSTSGAGGIAGATGFAPLFTNGISGNNITFVGITQAPNVVFAGPSLGSPALPTFRSLVVADLPTGIPSSYLVSSNINFALGTSGTDVNWSSSSVTLGNSAILNIPTASATSRGALASADWTTFNSKVTSVNGLTGVVITKSADSLMKLPIDTSARRNGWVLSFDSTNHKWYLAAGGSGGGTSYVIGAIDGNGAAANGLSISGSSIYAQSASAAVPGMVNNSTQGFSGNKSFGGSMTLTGLANKNPTVSDSVVLRDASGKLWTFAYALLAKYTDTASMLANYVTTAGNLAPLFTSSVASHVINFSLTNATAHKFFGNFTGSTGAPSYSNPVLASADFPNQGTTTTVLHGNAAGSPAWGSVALATDISGILPIINGGTGSSTFAITGGIGVKVTGSVPNYIIASDTANFKDTVNFRNLGTVGDSLGYVIGGTTIGIRRVFFRSNFTVIHNADSSLTVDATGGGGSGTTTVGPINSQSPSTDGLVIVGTSIYAQYGTATAPGMISTVAQTIAGAKTFSSAPTFSTLTTNGGPLYATSSGTVTQAGSGSATQVLHGGSVPSYSAVALTTDISGILPIINGGTGTAAPAIINGGGLNIVGSFPNYTISTINNGTVTSVQLSGGSTGLTFSGGPITSNGTITESGTLVPANGGTGGSSWTPNAVMLAGSTATGTFQNVSNGLEGQILTFHVGSIPTWTTPSSGGSGGDYTVAFAVNSANYTITTANYIDLPDLTGQANRNLVLPAASSGKRYIIKNNNPVSSGFNWIFTGRTVRDFQNNTITTLAPNAVYQLVDDNTNINIVN